ncbi:N-alpha-acetyltransferase 38, NatC auxiliary subunit [Euwallacea similis]|uniref:N-alpha-acetyltransferase 38, NatC auxiliary subunit n=1 Tax=Euwallacea similis TaxID=1736056 RepID=UPI00344F0339
MDDNESDSGSNRESEEEDNSDFDHDTPYSSDQSPTKPLNTSPGATKLRSWLNKTLKVLMTDGRTLIGVFLCTDRDANVILGSCSEYLPADTPSSNEDPRMLGLVMIPGKHIVTVHIDMGNFPNDGHINNSTGEVVNYV